MCWAMDIECIYCNFQPQFCLEEECPFTENERAKNRMRSHSEDGTFQVPKMNQVVQSGKKCKSKRKIKTRDRFKQFSSIFWSVYGSQCASVCMPAQVDIFTIFGLFTSSIFGSCYWLSDKISTNCYPLGIQCCVSVCLCVSEMCRENVRICSSAATMPKFHTNYTIFILCHFTIVYECLRSDVCVLHFETS